MITTRPPHVHRARRASRENRPPTNDPKQAAHLTDYGNGVRLVRSHGKDILHCHPWKKWCVWDGKRWKLDDTAEVMRRAKQTIADMYSWCQAEIEKLKAEIAADPDGSAEKSERLEAIEKTLQWALKSEDSRRLAAMIELAKSEPGIPILPEQLDADPLLFNVANGTLDLRTGQLRPHQQSDLITKLCNLAYDPSASCPLWLRTLELILAGDDDIQGFLQRFFGHCLTGDVREQILPVLWGSGSNGKSVLLGTIMYVMGPDYSMQADATLLMKPKGERHLTELADLFGKRLVVASESEHEDQLNESRIKKLTGGDPVRCRRMREDSWQYDPVHKIVLGTNYKPLVRGTDHAIWRRLCLIPFNVRFWEAGKGQDGPPELKADELLPQKLRAEAPGILAWLVHGCLAWQRNGLGVPDAIRAATADYRTSEDVLSRFQEQCCVRGGSDYRIRAGKLYQVYKSWCDCSGEKAKSLRWFGEEMERRGVVSQKSDGVWYVGIQLNENGKEIDQRNSRNS